MQNQIKLYAADIWTKQGVGLILRLDTGEWMVDIWHNLDIGKFEALDVETGDVHHYDSMQELLRAILDD